MRHYFTYHHDVNGRTALEIECEIVASVELDSVTGDPVVTVDSVYIDGPDGIVGLDDTTDPILRLLSDAIAKAAQANDEFRERVIEEEGIAYAGCGANDPYGRFVRVA